MREIEAKQKEVRDAKLAIEKARAREGKLLIIMYKLIKLILVSIIDVSQRKLLPSMLYPQSRNREDRSVPLTSCKQPPYGAQFVFSVYREAALVRSSLSILLVFCCC